MILHPVECSSVTSITQGPSRVPEAPAHSSQGPASRSRQGRTPQRVACQLLGVPSPPARFCHSLRGDYSSFWTLRHTSWRQGCKAALGIPICIIAGQERSFQSGPCPCLRLLRVEAPAGDCSSCGAERTEGLFVQTFLLPVILISRVIPATGRERPPFPFKGYPRFVVRLLGAKADLTESEPRAAPLIREVLPDSFSKDFPRKLDVLAAIWTTCMRNLTGFAGRHLSKMKDVRHFSSS